MHHGSGVQYWLEEWSRGMCNGSFSSRAHARWEGRAREESHVLSEVSWGWRIRPCIMGGGDVHQRADNLLCTGTAPGGNGEAEGSLAGAACGCERPGR